jgi:hypothetical protein
MPATKETVRIPTLPRCSDSELVADMVHYGFALTDAVRIFAGGIAVRYLRLADGNLSQAAKLAKCHRNTFSKYVPQEIRDAARREGRNGRLAKERLAKAKEANGGE